MLLRWFQRWMWRTYGTTSHLVEGAVGLERIGFHERQQLIWNKTAAAMSRRAYHWKHEPCWYAVRRGKTARWLGSRDQNTIWDAASPKRIMGGSTEANDARDSSVDVKPQSHIANRITAIDPISFPAARDMFC
jgi:hypothetical protein